MYHMEDLIKPNKVIVIYGPRRAGKTTLLNDYLAATKLKYKLDSGDNIRTQLVLSSQDFSQILDYASGYDLIAIDEAQQIPNRGVSTSLPLGHAQHSDFFADNFLVWHRSDAYSLIQ